MDRFKDNNSPSSSFIFCGRGKSKLLFDTLVCSNGLSTAKKAIDCNELTNWKKKKKKQIKKCTTCNKKNSNILNVLGH